MTNVKFYTRVASTVADTRGGQRGGAKGGGGGGKGGGAKGGASFPSPIIFTEALVLKSGSTEKFLF